MTGSLQGTKKVAQHRGAAHKMALLPDNPYVVLSAGEDGQVPHPLLINLLPHHLPLPLHPQVLSVDIREQKPDKLLLLKNEKEKKVPIYSVHSSPANSNLFCTAGKEQFVRIFDRR